MVQVIITSDAREDLRDLDDRRRRIALQALGDLRRQWDRPTRRQDTDLTGRPTGFHLLLVGDRDLKIIYRIEHDDTVVVVWVVTEQVNRNCYEIALARLELAAGRADLDEVRNMLQEVWTVTATQA